MSARKPDAPDTWPIFWRVVAPAAGGFDHDMVFLETPVESKARTACGNLRSSGYAVRLERVSCGPLPKGALGSLKALRAQSPQNPGAEMRPVLGRWEAP